VTITEPTTMLTDYLLGGLAAWFAIKLARRSRWSGKHPVFLWAAAFAGLALASFSGGAYHGFTEYLESTGLAILWKITLYSIGVVSLTLFSAATIAAFEGRTRQVLLAAGVLKFGVYAIWIINHDDFLYAILDYAPAMLYVLALQARAWLRREKSGRWAVAGVLVSFAAAGVQQSGFTLHRHFNHNDLYHVIQMLGIYLLYRGGSLLAERGSSGPVETDGAEPRP
jgi:hypothetical protein